VTDISIGQLPTESCLASFRTAPDATPETVERIWTIRWTPNAEACDFEWPNRKPPPKAMATSAAAATNATPQRRRGSSGNWRISASGGSDG